MVAALASPLPFLIYSEYCSHSLFSYPLTCTTHTSQGHTIPATNTLSFFNNTHHPLIPTTVTTLTPIPHNTLIIALLLRVLASHPPWTPLPMFTTYLQTAPSRSLLACPIATSQHASLWPILQCTTPSSRTPPGSRTTTMRSGMPHSRLPPWVLPHHRTPSHTFSSPPTILSPSHLGSLVSIPS